MLAELRDGTWVDRERLRVYPRIFLMLYALAIVAWLVLADGLIDLRGEPVGTDFVSFWAASALARAGNAAAAYDFAAHAAVEQAAVGSSTIPYFSWHYPPMYQVVVLPLSLLSYGWSLLAWVTTTLVAYLAVVRRLLPRPETTWLALAFPAVFLTLGHGQNGFLLAALLGAALHMIDERPTLAGVLLGALCIKPQVALLVPFALVAGRRWRTLVATVSAAAGSAAASYLLLGQSTWTAFVENVPIAGRVLSEGLVSWHKMQSVYAALRLLGASHTSGAIVQSALAVGVLVLVASAWRRRDTAPELRASILVVGSLLATPFLLDYDLVLLALPIAWLARIGLRDGFEPWERTTLAVIWVLPLVARLLAEVGGIQITPLALGWCLILIVRRLRASTAGTTEERAQVTR